MMKSLRMFSIADYFSLCELKILVRIYLTESNKETYEPVMDDFKTNNISKVLRNYLRRLIVIDYDRELLEKIFNEPIDTNSITTIKEINPNLTKTDIIKALCD